MADIQNWLHVLDLIRLNMVFNDFLFSPCLRLTAKVEPGVASIILPLLLSLSRISAIVFLLVHITLSVCVEPLGKT